jgi:ATP-dependent helicase/nuclease subunit A
MSAEVRQTAIDPAGSFLVQAPAGSGKTELLTRRILSLLAVVDEPEEILALTFTRKAAAEMRGRVIAALTMDQPGDDAVHRMETWRLACVANRRSAERGWHLPEHPSRLNMMTLDSLTHALARQLPVLSGLGEMPAPSTHVAPLYRDAAEAAVAMLVRRHPDQAEAVLLHQDHNLPALIALVADMLSRRDQWLHELARHADDAPALRAMQERILAGIMQQKLDRCADLVPPDAKAALPPLLRFAGSNLDDPLLAGLKAWPDADLEQLPIWQRIADLLLKKNEPALRQRVDKGIGFPADHSAADHKQAFVALLGQLSVVDDLAGVLDELRSLPSEPRLQDEQWRVLEAQLSLLLMADAQLQRLFSERGEADFTEISLRALRALEDEGGNPTDLLMRLDYRIRHILVDEFQDTSLLQLRLLRNLTEGWQAGDGTHRTLFMVGDPMQSIYRFRKAEVGLFLLAAANRAELPPVTELNLTRNFRSSPVIVDWVNRAFSFVLPDKPDILLGAVSYAGAHAALEHGGEVHLHLQAGVDAAAEAAAVTTLVRQELAKDQQRIAVLARSRRHLHAIMPALADAGIRFRAVDILPLSARPEIRLLRALVRAMLHPADRVSWAALLRAPCCGLPTAAMHQLLAGDERPVVEILTDADKLAGLDADARARADHLCQALVPCLQRSGRMPVRSLLQMAWDRLAMSELIGADASHNVEAMLDLVSELDTGGLVDFALLDERLEQLYASPDTDPEAVRVELLTMHGAKGLQWDVVILPGLGHGNAKSDAPLLAFTDVALEGSVQPLIALRPPVRRSDAVYGLVRSIERIRGNNELARLLYVATTRAETTLHMFGHVHEKTEAPVEGSLLRLLLPAGIEDGCFGAAVHVQEVPPAQAGHVRPQLTRVSRLPAVAHIEPAGADTEESEYFWAGPEAAPVGNAVHAALQHVAEVGIEQWTDAASQAEARAMRAMLLAEGLSGDMLDRAGERCAAALARVLKSERAAWLLSGAHAEARSEWALSSRHGGAVSHHVIDRSFVDDDGVRWIVDYKTGEHAGGDTAAFLDAEVQRHRPQLLRYARLLQAKEGLPLRLGLYFPMIDGWRELAPDDAGPDGAG